MAVARAEGLHTADVLLDLPALLTRRESLGSGPTHRGRQARVLLREAPGFPVLEPVLEDLARVEPLLPRVVSLVARDVRLDGLVRGLELHGPI